jgi:hypothetical protein
MSSQGRRVLRHHGMGLAQDEYTAPNRAVEGSLRRTLRTAEIGCTFSARPFHLWNPRSCRHPQCAAGIRCDPAEPSYEVRILGTTEVCDALLPGRNTDLIGTPLHYAAENEQAVGDAAATRLREACIVAVRQFPPDPQVLLRFVCRVGQPLPRHGRSGTDPLDFIGDVRFRPDVEPERRLVTQGNDELAFHTARAYTSPRPRYFAMLMAEPGWTDEAPGQCGESLLVRWTDVVAELASRHPEHLEDDLALLRDTPVSYTPSFAPTSPVNEPLMVSSSRIDTVVRYWEGMLDTVPAWIGQIPAPDRYLAALRRFDAAANTCSRAIEYQMERSQLILIDNHRVAHARRPFIATRVDAAGLPHYNPRQILSVYIA